MDYQLSKLELRLLKSDRHSFHLLKKFPIVCILYKPISLFNIGSIIRTCEAFRIEKLIICSEEKINLNSKKIKKTSKNTYKWLNISIEKDIFNILKEYKDKNYTLISVELTQKSFDYTKVNFSFPGVFIFGNERSGISNEIINSCDFSIHIPLYGMGNSLNLSVCTGIILAHALNKYLIKM